LGHHAGKVGVIAEFRVSDLNANLRKASDAFVLAGSIDRETYIDTRDRLRTDRFR